MTTVGKIQKTFGARGELLLALYSGAAQLPDSPLFIAVDGLNVPFYLKSAEKKGSKYVVVFDDMESEKLAQELVGKEVMAELSTRQQRKHSATASGTTLDELATYKVVDVTCGELGTVSCRLDYPGNPCLQIINAQGQEIIIPANSDLFVSVDEKEKVLMVDLPQGLVGVYVGGDTEN